MERPEEVPVGPLPVRVRRQVETLLPGPVAVVQPLLFGVGTDAATNNHAPYDLGVPEQGHEPVLERGVQQVDLDPLTAYGDLFFIHAGSPPQQISVVTT